jgi:hypothetical protein
MKIGQNIKLIKSLLEEGGKDDIFRDNDNKLIAITWHRLLEESGIDTKTITGWTFLTHLSKGDLPAPESITRCRRKLQELYPKLRGTTWEKRHKKQVAVKKELSNLTL